MKVLITGIGGFIGQNVANYLTQKGIEVIGVFRNKEPYCMVEKMFFCDLFTEDVGKYINNERVDAIIHFAGQMKGKNVYDYLNNTIESTRKLINYAESIQIAQFIYISSISVYGETLSSVDENSDRINLDDYGMSKYLCERMLEDAEIKKRIVLRLPRTLGKGIDLSYPWLPQVAGQMLMNQNIYYSNPDLLYNNILYIDDLSEFLLLLLNKDFEGFERFVLSANEKMKIIEILHCLKRNLSSTSRLIEIKPNQRNKCYAINPSHAEANGFRSRNIIEIINKFAKDIK